MTLNVHIQRTIAGLGIVGTLAFGAWAGSAIGNASPDQQGMVWVDTQGEAWLSPEDCPSACRPLQSVNLTEIDDIDVLPVCAEEDCSDQFGQIGVWYSKSTGDWFLERGEGYTRVIVDDTAGYN